MKNLFIRRYEIEDDYQLAQLIVHGDRQTFYKIYHRLLPKVKSYTLGKVSNKQDADEIIQDVFLNFIGALPLYNGRSTLSTFILSITRHEVADYYRKKYAKKLIRYVPLFENVEFEKLMTSSQTSKELHYIVEHVYSLIPPKYKLVLTLKYEDNLKIDEIADKLQISLKATESLLFRSRQTFQKIFAKHYGSPEFSIVKAK